MKRKLTFNSPYKCGGKLSNLVHKRDFLPLNACLLSPFAIALMLTLAPTNLVAQPENTTQAVVAAQETRVAWGTLLTPGEKEFTWRRYAASWKAAAEPDWTLDLGKTIKIQGKRMEPQARVGARTNAIPIVAPRRASVYNLTVDWEGDNIHRSGFFYTLVDSAGKVIREGEYIGRGGEFSETVSVLLPVPEKNRLTKSELLLYFFHDGQGTLTVKGLRLEPQKTDEPGMPQRRGSAILERKHDPLDQIFRLPARKTPEVLPFPAKFQAPLLKGESRWLSTLTADDTTSMGTVIARHGIQERFVAVSHTWGTEESRPTWLTVDSKNPAISRLTGNADTVTELPPLPENRHVYLYYYGKLRYGKSDRDATIDKAEMIALREAGITGLVVHDNYGLDYDRYTTKGDLDGAYLKRIAGIYKEAGFKSPFVYRLYTGMERDKVTFTPTDARASMYLTLLAAQLKEAEAILGGQEQLRITLVDEPNEPERIEKVVAALPLWREFLPWSLVVPCNWNTSRILAKHGIEPWVGAGDYPSFEPTAHHQLGGFYLSLDPGQETLRHRHVAGVHAWRTGMPSQARWHHHATAGTIESDLDGKMRDFSVGRWVNGKKTIEWTTHGSALLEGIQDLRLLLALEGRLKDEALNADTRTAITEFLGALRKETNTTDRTHTPWDRVETYENMRAQAVGLLAR